MAERHTIKEDTTVELEDGRLIQYKGGDEISMAEAVSVGLVKEPKRSGPAETKDEGPAEVKTTAKAASRKK